MNLVDLAIVVAIGLGVVIGWRNGLIGPLLAEGTFLIAWWIMATHPSLIGLVPPSIPRPIAPFVLPAILGVIVGIFGRLVFQMFFRLPFTRQVDKLLGAVANGGLAFVIVYVVLVSMVSAGAVLDPLSKVASIQPPQVAAMQMLLAENPQAGAMIPAGELGQLASAAAVHPVPLAQLGQYSSVLQYYEKTLRPQLSSSQLAPLVLRLGAHLPIIGRHVTLPSPAHQ